MCACIHMANRSAPSVVMLLTSCTPTPNCTITLFYYYIIYYILYIYRVHSTLCSSLCRSLARRGIYFTSSATASKKRPHDSEPPVARAGQHPGLHFGWTILPTRIGYCSNTNCARRFRCEDNSIVFTHVQPLHYHVRSVEPCH